MSSVNVPQLIASGNIAESRPHHEATWQKVIAVVKEHGGDIEKTESGCALVRVVGTTRLHFALPMVFDPDSPDANGSPSPFTLDSIERNLHLKLPYYPVL